MVTIENITIHNHFGTSPEVLEILKEIQMDKTAQAAALNTIADTLNKALAEIVAATAALAAANAAAGQTTPEQDAAQARLQAVADTLDALNPDTAAPVDPVDPAAPAA